MKSYHNLTFCPKKIIFFRMSKKQWFIDLAKGAALGTGVLPGVSVGTVGLIVNVYDKLLGAISGLTKHFWEAFKTLLPIALGCIAAAVLFLFGYSKLSDFIGFELICCFAGATLGGMPIILNEMKGKSVKPVSVVRIIACFIIAAGIGILSVIAKNQNWFDFAFAFENPGSNWWIYLVIFFVGVVAAIACLIPGISGSMVLFIFGLYNPIVDMFSLSKPNSIFNNHSRIASGLILLLILLIGVVLGLIAFAKVMKSLMAKHHDGTFECVIGFVLGSVVSIFVNNSVWSYYSSLRVIDYIVGPIAFIGCAALFIFLTKRSLARKQ